VPGRTQPEFDSLQAQVIPSLKPDALKMLSEISVPLAKGPSKAAVNFLRDHLKTISEIIKLLPSFSQPPPHRDYALVAASCKELGAYVAKAESIPKIPQPDAEIWWKKFLSGLTTTARDCEKGAAQNNQELLGQVPYKTDVSIVDFMGFASALGYPSLPGYTGFPKT
jgi:hypothetical protein